MWDIIKKKVKRDSNTDAVTVMTHQANLQQRRNTAPAGKAKQNQMLGPHLKKSSSRK